MNKKKLIIIVAVIAVLIVVGLFFLSTTKTGQEIIPTRTTETSQVEPEEKYGKLIIKGSPENAMVSISALKTSYIKEEQTSLEIEIPIGKYMVVGFAENYKNYEEEIEIKEGDEKEISFVLEFIGQDVEEGGPINDQESEGAEENLVPTP